MSVHAELVTKAGTTATVSMGGYGWLATILNWDWSTISFIVATVCAITTMVVNWYYRRKASKLQEEALKKGVAIYEFKD